MMKYLTRCGFVLFISLLFSIFLLPEVLAISIAPGGVEIPYAPGKSQTQDFVVGGAVGRVLITVEGSLNESITISEPEFNLNGGSHTITTTFTFPDELPPGEHTIYIKAKETSGKVYGRKSMISALAAVRSWIKTYVPYPDEFAEISLKFENQIQLGEIAYFEVNLRNRGSKIIRSAKGELTIKDYTNNEIVTTVPLTQVTNIPPDGSKQLYAEWNTAGVKPGEYLLQAHVDYADNKSVKTKGIESIIVGEIKLEILELTPLEMPVEQVTPLNLLIGSVWNKEMSAYAELQLKNGQDEVVKTTKTPTFTIARWRKENIELFLDAFGITPGNYKGEVTLYYSGKETKREFDFNLTEAVEKAVTEKVEIQKADSGFFSTTVIIIIIIVVALGAGALAYLYGRKGKGERKEEF